MASVIASPALFAGQPAKAGASASTPCPSRRILGGGVAQLPDLILSLSDSCWYQALKLQGAKLRGRAIRVSACGKRTKGRGGNPKPGTQARYAISRP